MGTMLAEQVRKDSNLVPPQQQIEDVPASRVGLVAPPPGFGAEETESDEVPNANEVINDPRPRTDTVQSEITVESEVYDRRRDEIPYKIRRSGRARQRERKRREVMRLSLAQQANVGA